MAVEICIFMVWQQRKWPRFLCSIWFSHEDNLFLKALQHTCLWRYGPTPEAAGSAHPNVLWCHKERPTHTKMFAPGALMCFSLCFPETDIFPFAAQNLFSTFPRLKHLTSVWDGTSGYSEPHSSRKDLNWWWFRPLALTKVTTLVTVVIPCSIFRALPHSNSWCMIQW